MEPSAMMKVSMSSARKIRALLADDEKHVRQLVKAILLPLNCEVAGEAENGQEAVRIYRDLRPDVVLLDINMPVMGGIDALREIRRIDADAVVVMLTSMSDLDTVQTSLELGAVQYVRKDTPTAQIRQLLREVWKEQFDA